MATHLRTSSINGERVAFLEAGRIAEITFNDRIHIETMMPVIVGLKKDARYAGLNGVVWDLRDADLSVLTLQTLKDIFSTQKSIPPTKTLRVACVIASDSDSDILKLWETGLHSANPNHRKWFLDLTAARAWASEVPE